MQQPVCANRSSLLPPVAHSVLPSLAPVAQKPVPGDEFPSFQQSDFMGGSGNSLQKPSWLQSGGKVDYASMMQQLLQAKRGLQVCIFFINDYCALHYLNFGHGNRIS
jgi:hypothetical protein